MNTTEYLRSLNHGLPVPEPLVKLAEAYRPFFKTDKSWVNALKKVKFKYALDLYLIERGDSYCVQHFTNLIETFLRSDHSKLTRKDWDKIMLHLCDIGARWAYVCTWEGGEQQIRQAYGSLDRWVAENAHASTERFASVYKMDEVAESLTGLDDFASGISWVKGKGSQKVKEDWRKRILQVVNTVPGVEPRTGVETADLLIWLEACLGVPDHIVPVGDDIQTESNCFFRNWHGETVYSFGRAERER